MTLPKRLKERRRALNMTLLQVAEALGVQEATVQRYESGKIKSPKHETVLRLAEILNCTPGYLMGWDDLPTDAILPPDNQRIPILGVIRAGQPIFANEEVEYYPPFSDCKADFGLRVTGDSMINAGIKDGDIVFIRRQETVDDGDIAAVIIDDEATLKRVYKNENTVTLVAENPKYKPMVFTPESGKSIRILGKAVSCTTRL